MPAALLALCSLPSLPSSPLFSFLTIYSALISAKGQRCWYRIGGQKFSCLALMTMLGRIVPPTCCTAWSGGCTQPNGGGSLKKPKRPYQKDPSTFKLSSSYLELVPVLS